MRYEVIVRDPEVKAPIEIGSAVDLPSLVAVAKFVNECLDSHDIQRTVSVRQIQMVNSEAVRASNKSIAKMSTWIIISSRPNPKKPKKGEKTEEANVINEIEKVNIN